MKNLLIISIVSFVFSLAIKAEENSYSISYKIAKKVLSNDPSYKNSIKKYRTNIKELGPDDSIVPSWVFQYGNLRNDFCSIITDRLNQEGYNITTTELESTYYERCGWFSSLGRLEGMQTNLRCFMQTLRDLNI